MKKIETREDIEKREKRNRTIVGAVLVAVLIIGTLGYGFLSRQETKENVKEEEYKGLKFIMTEQGFWFTEISGYGFYFQNLPKDVENISVPFIQLNEYYNKPLYFVFNDGNMDAKNEVYRSLQAFTSRLPQDACLRGRDCTNNELPEENCSSNVIVFDVKNETKVYREENCVFIESTIEEMTRAADAFLYRLLGVL